MKKSEQELVNWKIESFLCELDRRDFTVLDVKPLRYCNARVQTLMDNLTGELVFELKSYNTLVAIIDGGVCYDILRYTYGYTATSAQHITKFCKDYWDGCKVLRWYP